MNTRFEEPKTMPLSRQTLNRGRKDDPNEVGDQTKDKKCYSLALGQCTKALQYMNRYKTDRRIPKTATIEATREVAVTQPKEEQGEEIPSKEQDNHENATAHKKEPKKAMVKEKATTKRKAEENKNAAARKASLTQQDVDCEESNCDKSLFHNVDPRKKHLSTKKKES